MSDTNTIKHPGEYLLSEIARRNMKQNELAIRTGVSEKHISTILNGTKDISPSFARKLEIALGSEKGYWLKLQAEYDAEKVRIEEENGITDEEIGILKLLKDITDYFIKQRIMHNDCPEPDKILQLREILRVSNLTAIPKITYNAAYRAQVKSRSNTNIDPFVLFSWQRLCEIQTESIIIANDFSKELLQSNLDRIRQEISSPKITESLDSLKAIFAECGIAFDVVKHFRGAPVQGFIKQTDNGKVILCLTLRGKKADRFWFTLFHEIGHLLNGDLNTRFVDFSSIQGNIEERADAFARDTIIPPEPYMHFVALRGYTDINVIKRFSDKIGIPYWMTIGRLQSDGWLDWSDYANASPRYVWVENA